MYRVAAKRARSVVDAAIKAVRSQLWQQYWESSVLLLQLELLMAHQATHRNAVQAGTPAVTERQFKDATCATIEAGRCRRGRPYLEQLSLQV